MISIVFLVDAFISEKQFSCPILCKPVLKIQPVLVLLSCSVVWWYGGGYSCIFCQMAAAGLGVISKYPLGSVQTCHFYQFR